MKKSRWKLIRREYSTIPLTPTLRMEMEIAIYEKQDPDLLQTLKPGTPKQ